MGPSDSSYAGRPGMLLSSPMEFGTIGWVFNLAEEMEGSDMTS